MNQIIADLAPLAGAAELRELVLDGNPLAQGLGPLAPLTKVQTLSVRATGITGLTTSA